MKEVTIEVKNEPEIKSEDSGSENETEDVEKSIEESQCEFVKLGSF